MTSALLKRHTPGFFAKPKLRGFLHLVAAPIALVAGVFLVVNAATLEWKIAAAVYVFTAVNLFGVSATYHIGDWTDRVRRTLRRLDHANIFLIIAGTYTPLAVALLEGEQARVLLILIWSAALVGVGLSTLWPTAPRWLNVPLYLMMGWASVFYIPDMIVTGGSFVIQLVALGGVLYSIGAICYALKWPNFSLRWFGFHELFHAFTVAAFGVQFVAIALTVN